MRAQTPTSACSDPARCPAPSGSPARGSTTPSTCSGATRIGAGRGDRALEDPRPVDLTFGELRDQVARARAGLHRLGVGRGDRVVAYLPNIPETLVAFLATASLGRDLGVRRARVRGPQRDRPLLADRAQRPDRGRRLHLRQQADRPSEEVAAIRQGLPTLEHVVDVAYGDDACRGRSSCASPARSRSSRCRSTTRSTCSSRPARPGCRRRSCTATAGSSLEHFKNLGPRLGPQARRHCCCGSPRPRG